MKKFFMVLMLVMIVPSVVLANDSHALNDTRVYTDCINANSVCNADRLNCEDKLKIQDKKHRVEIDNAYTQGQNKVLTRVTTLLLEKKSDEVITETILSDNKIEVMLSDGNVVYVIVPIEIYNRLIPFHRAKIRETFRTELKDITIPKI